MKYIFVALSIFLVVIFVLGSILAVVEQATAAITGTGQEQTNSGQRIVVFVAQLFQTNCRATPCNDDPIVTEAPCDAHPDWPHCP